jgi:hypothetical protein
MKRVASANWDVTTEIRKPTIQRSIFRNCLISAIPLFLLVLLSPLFTFHSSVLRAQSESASLSGTIVDQKGGLVPDTQVSVVNMDTNVTLDAKTNSAGVYNFPFLAPGRYRILISKQGFKQIDLRDVTLHTQDSVSRNFTLDVGGTSETVIVNAETVNIDTQDASVGTIVDRNFAENLPLNGRSFQTLILLTPGTVIASQGNDGGTFSVNGQRADSNNFTVDGASANLGGFLQGQNGTVAMNGSNPDLSFAGTTQGMVSVDALQEFKIQTSTYSPEFGRQPGGQVSLLTRSGTNAFHGTAFDYLRNDVFDANNWFNDQQGLPKGKERQNDFGGTVGGPIYKDRLFFFFSYEGLRLLQPRTFKDLVPTSAFRQSAAPVFQPFMNFLPLPNGRDLGNGAAELTQSISLPTTFDVYSVKVDYAATKRLHLFGRYSDTTSDFRQPFDIGIYQEQKFQSRGGTLGADVAISPSVNDELRLNYTVNPSNTVVVPPASGGKLLDTSSLFPKPLIDGEALGEWRLRLDNGIFTGIDAGPIERSSQRQINIVDNLSYAVGTHQLRWGIDYRRLFPIYDATPQQVVYTITSNTDLANGTISETSVQANVKGHPIFVNFSAYGQDTWRLSRRLTVTYGLRWEFNPTPGERDGLDKDFLTLTGIDPATATVRPLGSSLYQTSYANFAPRFGLAFQVRQAQGHETIVRGGLGLFYDLDSQEFALNLVGGIFRNQNLYNSLQFPVPDNTSLSLPPVPNLNQTPPFFALYWVDPKIRSPYTLQWNVSVEQGLGRNQSLVASYVASQGYHLLDQAALANFNPLLVQDVLTFRSNSSSNYQSLQLQFNRRLSNGLQALVAYTYSHSIDNSSDGLATLSSVQGMNGLPNPNVNRGNSDFDLRHAFRGAVTYIIPTWNADSFLRELLGGWSVESIGIAQSGTPVDLTGGFAPDFLAPVRPDIVPDQSLYLSGAACTAINGGVPCPGGRQFNPNAFSRVPTDSNGVALRQGTLGRNFMRGLGAWQVDFALHRQFRLTEHVNLQFRGEFFNIFNHPNFSCLDANAGDTTLGQASCTLNTSYGGLNSLYQIGGPRSIQLGLKLTF